ncbi:unnamed protein product [Symbiodinium sp. CCMP2592]|nr:unnamed protein product [Symbiodinium sp. CCMP2592]
MTFGNMKVGILVANEVVTLCDRDVNINAVEVREKIMEYRAELVGWAYPQQQKNYELFWSTQDSSEVSLFGKVPNPVDLEVLMLIKVYRFGELFAGAANVTTAVKLHGIPAFKMDKIYYGGFDFLAPAGFSFLGCF